MLVVEGPGHPGHQRLSGGLAGGGHRGPGERSHGQRVSVRDAIPGDTRDTSSPRALATDLRRDVLGRLLPPARAHELTEQLLGNATGGPYIRAGVPAGWTVGDKTGNGGYGSRNDIAVVWPPLRSPIVIALLSHRGEQNSSSADALLADATRVVVADLR